MKIKAVRPVQPAAAVSPRTPESKATVSHQLYKFAVPLLFLAVCASVCSFLLHVRTHLHITRYFAKKSVFKEEPLTALPDLLRGSLENSVFSFIGDRMLDHLVLWPMAAFVLLMLRYRDLKVFTKVMLCCGLLSLGKGICALLTELPDSRGGAQCIERLTHPRWNVHAKDMLLALDFENRFWGSVGTTFGFQLNSFLSLGGKGAVRYCSDMMYSGHTFFCTIICFSISRLVMKHNAVPNRSLRLSVYALLAAIPVIEALAVVATKFHYSVDVFVAIILTALVWSYPPIDKLAGWWSRERARRPSEREEMSQLFIARGSSPDTIA